MSGEPGPVTDSKVKRFMAQFEQKDSPMTERDAGYPYGEFDARKWAEEFDRIFPDTRPDTATMLGWFANAIMTGYDKAKHEKAEASRTVLERADRAFDGAPDAVRFWATTVFDELRSALLDTLSETETKSVLPPLTPIGGLDIKSVRDILSPEAQAELDEALRTMARERRAGEASARTIPLP